MPCEPTSGTGEIRYFLDRTPDAAQVEALYRAEGWITPDDKAAYVPAMLEHSFAVVTAYRGERLIGMMRALSDGVSDAYLLDLVVDAAFRRRGIGRELLILLKDHLAGLGIDWIVLIGAPGTESFYKASNAAPMEHYVPFRFPTR